MSDGEPYDADGDVSRFLHCPSPEVLLFPLSEPAPTTGVQGHPARPQTLNAAPDSSHQAPTVDAGRHDAPAAPPIYTEHYEAPAIDAVHYEAPPPINSVSHEAPPIVNAEHYEAPPINDQEDHHQLAAMDDGEQYQAMAMDVIQPAHMMALPPETQQSYGFPAPMQGVVAVHHQAPPMNADHHQAATANTDLFQVSAMDDVEQAMLMDLMLAPEMQQGRGGFPADPTLVQGHGVNAPIIAAEHYQEPIINGVDDDHQLPAMDVDDDQQMAMDVLQPTQMLAPDEMMQQGYKYAPPDPSLLHGEQHSGAPVIAAEHHQAPAINAAEEHHQVPAMDVDPQCQTMPMDVHVQPTQMLMAPEMPDAAPKQGGGGGVDAAAGASFEGNMLANNGGVIPPPSISVCEQLIKDGEPELAAILQMIDGGHGGGGAGGGGAGEAADDQHHLLCPAEEDVVFKRIFPGQLDCSRCRSVRDILRQNGPCKKHFMVHSSYKGTFQHAVVHHMAIGPDGQFYTTVLLYHDLRGRRDEWVQSFIAKSVEKLNRTGQLLLDYTCSSEGAPECSSNNNIIAPPPQASNQDQHVELEVDTLSNLLSAAASTADDHQAASAEAAEPPQPPQGNTNSDAPSVPESAVPVEVSPEETQPAITQPQEHTADAALSVAETAAAPEAASSPKAAQPSSVTQAQENPDAPPSEAEAAAIVPEAAEPLASSRNEQQQQTTDAWENFAPFNWDGFQPDHILESSQLQPYDPASGVDVLLYPSMQEQLRLEKLKKESKRLSKMAIQDTPDYLNLNDDHYANAPNFGSQSFKNICENDGTFRMYKRRVSGLVRKIKKLEQNATRVGKGGLFTIKQKLEAYKSEKEELYDMIKRGLQEHERRNNGAGPSNVAAGTSNNNDAGPSDVAAADTSNNDTSPSNVAADTSDDNDDAGPSNAAAAGTSNNNDAGPSDVAADTANTNGEPSNVAGFSGTN